MRTPLLRTLSGIVLLLVAAFVIWQGLSRPTRLVLRHIADDVQTAAATSANLLLGSSTLARLDTATFTNCGNWLNRAIGNSQLVDIARYLSWTPVQHHPQHILLYAGENDLAQSKPAQQVAAEYMALLEQLMAHYPAAHIHILAIKHSPARQQHWLTFDEVNAKLQAYATLQPQLHYYANNLQRVDFSADGIHLTGEGYRRFLHGVTLQCKAATNG